jgi:AcrR family transcriptional regulator
MVMSEVYGPGATIEVGPSKAAARIRAAAVEMFAERGYGATSLRDITARLGLSPGAVYPHYKTKESLLYAISLEGHTAALSAVITRDSPVAVPADRLERTTAAYVEWHAVNHSLARVVQYELRSLSVAHYRKIATIRRKTTAVFTDILQSGVDTGDFGIADVEAAALAISSLCIDVSRWFPTRHRRNPTELAAAYVELVIHMVAARTPRRAPKVASKPPRC